MHVLCTTPTSGTGMFHPHVLITGLLRRQVTKSLSPWRNPYCSTIETTGFRCFVAGYDWHSNALDPSDGCK